MNLSATQRLISFSIMATHRFYIPADQWNLENLVLGEEESHHCLDVMRCREGDRVVVFNGKGTESEAQITVTEKGAVELKSLIVNQTPKPPASLTLGQAIPKGKNMDLIIQKATELGAARIVPLISERTVVQLSGDDLAKKQQKWQRVVIEACKQCGQNWLPEVGVPCSVDVVSCRARYVAFAASNCRPKRGFSIQLPCSRSESPTATVARLACDTTVTTASVGAADSSSSGEDASCMPRRRATV